MKIRSNAYFAILVRSKIKRYVASPRRRSDAATRRFWRVKLIARETESLRHINCVHLQKAADTGRIGSGTKGVVTLIGKQETYSNLTFAYQIIKFWHAYIDSSFERVFFNPRSIEDQDIASLRHRAVAAHEVDRARDEAVSPY